MKLNDIYMRDPYVFVENDTCYLLGTTDESAWQGQANGFLCYKSKDLINFEGPFTLFKANSDFWANENFWAPEMHKINNKYVILASFYKKGLHRASQALIGDSPLGPFKPTSKPFTPSNWDCLDATYFHFDNKNYAIFCHEWTQIHNGEICVGELNDSLTELKNIKTLFTAKDANWVRPINSSDIDFVTDGPFIYQMKNGELVMLWSSFTEDGYAIGMAKSKNIYGPWIQKEQPLYKNDSGHGMIFNFKNKKYLIIHNNNKYHLLERPVLIEIKEGENWLFIND